MIFLHLTLYWLVLNIKSPIKDIFSLHRPSSNLILCNFLFEKMWAAAKTTATMTNILPPLWTHSLICCWLVRKWPKAPNLAYEMSCGRWCGGWTRFYLENLERWKNVKQRNQFKTHLLFTATTVSCSLHGKETTCIVKFSTGVKLWSA